VCVCVSVCVCECVCVSSRISSYSVKKSRRTRSVLQCVAEEYTQSSVLQCMLVAHIESQLCESKNSTCVLQWNIRATCSQIVIAVCVWNPPSQLALFCSRCSACSLSQISARTDTRRKYDQTYPRTHPRSHAPVTILLQAQCAITLLQTAFLCSQLLFKFCHVGSRD